LKGAASDASWRSAAKLLTRDEARRIAVILRSCRTCCASRNQIGSD
jgi:hypothetical protein